MSENDFDLPTDFAKVGMDLADLVRKFPSDIPKAQLVDLFNVVGIRDEEDNEPSIRLLKKELIDLAVKHQSLIEQWLGVSFTEYADHIATLEKAREEALEALEAFEEAEEVIEEIVDDIIPEETIEEVKEATKGLIGKIKEKLTKDDEDVSELEVQQELHVMDKLDELDRIGDVIGLFQVRYIGNHGRVKHGANNGFAGVAYVFDRGSWVDVEEKDFRRIYYPNVRNAVLARKQPHWEVRVITATDRIIHFFREKVRHILNIKPERLGDVKYVTTDIANRLWQYEIRSIHELVMTPVLRLAEITGLNNGEIMDMLADARRALE